ncbi:MAG TPA: hypothetical protein VF725_14180 [Ktedonobacterales bacterium]
MADTRSGAPTPPDGTSGPGLGQRLAGFFRPATTGAGARRRPQSATSRFITGSVTFVLVAELLTFGLQYLNVQFKLNLEQPIAGPQISWFTWFFLINVVTIIALWIILQRLGLFPRDMWGPRNGTSARGGSGSASGGKSGGASGGAPPANQIPGIGKIRTRAERRYTATVEAAKTTTIKKRRFGRTTTSSGATTTSARTPAKAPVATVPNTEHDGSYERVRAAQRLRKRRAAR